MSKGASTLFGGPEVERPEIVVGLVGALGTDVEAVDRAVKDALVGVGYRSETVRVSALISELAANSGMVFPEPVTKIDGLMDLGDALRQAVDHGAAAAALAVLGVSGLREGQDRAESGEVESHATVVRQLKHPDEVRLLRSVYGPRFVLVGAWAPRAEREKAVADRLRRHHPGRKDAWYSEQVSRLLGRDEKDGEDRLGQRVRDTFQMADAYVALLPGREISPQLTRLVRLLFGAPFETPTAFEQAMFQAAGARLRSADAGRQVGAVVVDGDGELLVTGTNEVPKAGGGQYWADDDVDHRDFRYGYDGNERQKLALVTEVLQRLKDAPGWLAEGRAEGDVEEMALEALNGSGPLKDSRIGDLLEFGRVAHAEMAAICTAARRGTALGGMTMLSTTYPCHECARLIIAAGISRVVYVDPYPKSQVPQMYRHEIVDGPVDDDRRVVFEPFQGIAPRLYRSVFAMPLRARDEATGDYLDWDPAQSRPRLVAEAEISSSVGPLEDSVINRLEVALRDAQWLAEAEPAG